MGYVKGEARGQGSLFPVSLDELVPEDHVCRVLEAFVGCLDLNELGFRYASPSATGRPPYDPADLLKLYIYGYLHQVRSSRKLERECERNVEVMWLLGRLVPDFKTIARFRQENPAGVRSVCAQFVQFCRRAGLAPGEWVAVDGSKFQAVASRKAVWTAKRLAREQARLESEIGAYLARLDGADGADEPVLDPEAVRSALALLAQTGRDTVTVGEPDARLMKGTGPGYNLQSAVDAAHHLIVHHEVTDEVTDNRSLEPTALGALEATKSTTMKVLADAGYANGQQLHRLEQAGITPYVAPNRAVNNQGDGTLYDRRCFIYEPDQDRYHCPAGNVLERKQVQNRSQMVIYSAKASDCGVCPKQAQCTVAKQRFISRHQHEAVLQAVAQRTTPQHMRWRRAVVEHPFGTLKYQVFEKPRFLLRGKTGAGTEMAFGVLAYNLKRVMKVLGSAQLRQALLAQ